MMKMNEALKFIRTAILQMSQIEVAQKVKFSRAYVSECESGAREPSLEFLAAFAKIAKCDIWKIFKLAKCFSTAKLSSVRKFDIANRILNEDLDDFIVKSIVH
jgi:transcriptional regulator with XRE-family HTH domain